MCKIKRGLCIRIRRDDLQSLVELTKARVESKLDGTATTFALAIELLEVRKASESNTVL